MIFRFGKSIAWCALIFVISTLPDKQVPQVPVWNADKLVHALIYFCLALFLYGDIRKGPASSPRALAVAVLFSIAYGGALELLQNTAVVNRSGNWLDFGANALGALLAAAIILVLRHQRGLRCKNPSEPSS